MDVSKASVARMYDYLLGGTDNYESDWAACEELLRLAPSTQQVALINRQFLVRAVKYIAGTGNVKQYIDHGSGLPTQNNVHQVAQRSDKNARVAYVDNDPIVLAHGRMMLEENRNTAVIQADMLNTRHIFDRAEELEIYQPGRPTAALFVSVLHCIPDEKDPWQLVRNVIEELPSGSYLVLSHLASDDAQLQEDVTRLMRRVTGDKWGRVRSFAEVDRFFEGLEIVGELCDVSRWRPDSDLGPRQEQAEWIEYGGVARVP
ncbi:S-adenosyl methyltransferase [Streptomyces sp. BpilaLS-43]|uniref:SAM-dependent methyltransferase n=1 Tax=Streptomyces sp. BpilaLS-43 TaxID=1839778 RepID=UPI00081B533E|nr:SAM-dependent methyltransferase [Streptomyces sp. BpilaLS-43]SCD69415.1 S-adenosyl methyltransferase [Streptomyces sp. BpilaLS-43]